MMKKTLLLLTAFLFLASLGSAADYEETKDLDLSASGITMLDADTGAGFLKIRGVEGLDRIEVRAEFIVKKLSDEKAKKFIEDYLVLTLEKKGSKAVLTAKQKPLRNIFRNMSYAINLTVEVPESLGLKIDDGSGYITVTNIAGDVWIDDGSGDIELTDIGGNLEVDDGSGEIVARNVKGDILIEDGSGTIECTGCGGEVDIDDGSGTIRVRDAKGDVLISDGSGSISVSGVERDVRIRSDGSGSVSISDVGGTVYKKK